MFTLFSHIYAKMMHEGACCMCAKVTNDVVLSGPFAGMRYQRSALVSYCPKALGTYELELTPLIERLCSMPFELIINVGAAEGYYSIGLARRNPQAKVVTFEADERIRQVLRKMIQLNGMADRIAIKGFCDTDSLRNALSDPGLRLVVMDIEGAESSLLDPVKIPYLSDIYILVEIHDFVSRDLAQTIRTRFQQSHQITEIWSKPRKLSDFPRVPSSKQRFLRFDRLLELSLREGRPEPMRWLYLEPIT